MCGKHRCLPHLSLGKLTVTEQRIDIDVLAQILCALCHPCRCGNPLPERARRHIDTRREVHIRVPLQTSVDMTQRQKFIHGKEAAVSKCRIETGCHVSLREDKAVTIRIVRILRINTDLLVVEIGKILRR